LERIQRLAAYFQAFVVTKGSLSVAGWVVFGGTFLKTDEIVSSAAEMECKNWEIISCHIGYPILELIYVLLT
jgi:hypothetical protein